MTNKKLGVEDFYSQFHGVEHHNDAGDQVNPHWYEIEPHFRKGGVVDLKALANRKRMKGKVPVHKDVDTMRLEMIKKKKVK